MKEMKRIVKKRFPRKRKRKKPAKMKKIMI